MFLLPFNTLSALDKLQEEEISIVFDEIFIGVTGNGEWQKIELDFSFFYFYCQFDEYNNRKSFRENSILENFQSYVVSCNF